jgi:negative regulator of flagellin synthesis FlgM
MPSIDSISAQNISRAYTTQGTDATQSSAARSDKSQPHRRAAQAPKGDSVSLSEGARSLAGAREAVQNSPDVREHKVADIKQQISDGTYSVSSRVLARKMLANESQQS